MGEFDGKVAVVTGGGSGIGRATALGLAREGAAVSIWGRRRPPLDLVVAEIRAGGGRAVAFGCDVSDEGQVGLSHAGTRREFGPVDLLVANAGIGPSAPIGKTTPAVFRETLEVNLVGPFLCLKVVLPEMHERGFGRIVAVASTTGLAGFRFTSAYCASKHGLVGLVRAAAQDLVGSGVTVNAVCPGWTETELIERSAETIAAKRGGSVAEAKAGLLATTGQARYLSPEEVAQTILFLCGPAAAGISGQAWRIDGA